MDKKILIITLLAVVLIVGGFISYQGFNKDSVVTYLQYDELDSAGLVGEKSSGKYSNDSLGLSFKYDDINFNLFENDYKSSNNLLGIVVMSLDSEERIFDFSPAGYDTMRGCEDIQKNGFNGGDYYSVSCEELEVDGKKLEKVIFEESGLSQSYINDSVRYYVPTEIGVWYLDSYNTEKYNELENIVNSIDFY